MATPIFNSIVSSISVILLAALAGHVLKNIRSRRICRRFRESILPESVVYDGRSVRVRISNKTVSRIVIRQVYLECAAGWPHRFNFDRLNLTEERAEKLGEQRPDSVLTQAEIDRGFVELPPHTHGHWVSGPTELMGPDGEITKNFKQLHVSYHYETIFGGLEVKDLSAPEIAVTTNQLVDSHETKVAAG